ncbi:MAG: hypothetical protein JF623_00175 [Acidobacteria bacterium]|nr:hypothetical protein [Acidobacteriota bacterium]
MRVTVQPPLHVPTTAETAPRLVFVLFWRVTASVSAAHACGTPVTLTWVTLPLLSTFRVVVSDDDVQPLTVALPAPSFPVLRPRLAAEATPTDTSAAVSATPKMLVSRFTCLHLAT